MDYDNKVATLKSRTIPVNKNDFIFKNIITVVS